MQLPATSGAAPPPAGGQDLARVLNASLSRSDDDDEDDDEEDDNDDDANDDVGPLRYLFQGLKSEECIHATSSWP